MVSSSSSWGSVFRRLPLHLREGWRMVRQTRYDAGNDFARYPLAALARMYVSKKWHLFQSNLFLRPQVAAGARPYVYLGLHRQPESSVDVIGSWFSDQPSFIRTIARSIPLGHDLYVKLHISDVDGWPLRFYRDLESIPAVKIIGPTADSRRLLDGAALTITNSGTMAYEAGLLGKPAITFARVHFNELPTVRYCATPPDLPLLIEEQLARAPRPGDDAAIVEFMARMFAWSFPGMPNRSIFDTALKDSDLSSLVNAYQRLYDGFAPEHPRDRAS